MSPARTGLLVGLLCVSIGCSGEPKPVTVTGRLLRNQTPLAVAPDTYVTIGFVPEPATGNTYPATFQQEDGTYSVTLPPGNYRVNVFVLPANSKAPPPPPKAGPKVYEVKGNQQLDLEAPE